ncbi:HAD family hydrolase [Corynebacterium pseudopelargi]|uniref:Sugar phosphatase YidA n=1 Tax=Corynebacterium pseudopelargi TaxID=2080757 RepID=A0A3G6IW55_9CORY|nr:HAD family hydrolase [Corynebacterium pseudopelargi]AZA08310.1 Sugar phosphatase YidA [Corynebacterium pseudopelargi]
MIPALVVSDIDGTLLDSNERVSSRLRKAIGLLDGKAQFALATGRPPRWIFPVLEQLPIRPVCVCANGAVLYDSAADRVIEAKNLSCEAMRSVVRTAREVLPGGCSTAVERVGASAFEQPDELFVVTPEYIHAWDSTEHGCVEEAELLSKPAMKLLLRSEQLSAARMHELLAPVVPKDLAHITFSYDGGLLEVSAPGVVKARALQVLAADLGVSREQVLAFGDMPNDIEMLQWAGHGVAMANAHPDVKKAADEVTAANDDFGVARVIERIFS